MLTRGQKLVLLFAAALFAFVLACPETDTPTAVFKAPGLFLIVAVVFFIWKLPELEFLQFAPATQGAHRDHEDILALTCTRLC